ncbi:MAG TPA: energy transducer TonB [Steroidobacteraceae bacterium]|jgi:TonB family protein|nr:energy transducer TonB [Steroidobacteraceae bacterium]
MPKSLRKHELATPEAAERPALQSVKKPKLPAILVTADDSLWPQVGADLSSDLVLKQVDSIDELINSIPSGQAAIVLWDARNHAEPAAVLSRLHLHSSRFAIVALDAVASADAWTLPIQHRQVVAHVGLPIDPSVLSGAFDAASEEVHSRLALLGDGSAPPAGESGPPKRTWLVPAVIGGVLVAAVGVYLLSRSGSTEVKPAAGVASAPTKGAAIPAAAVKSPADADEKVDALMEKAQQAMLDRHFIDPLAGSALSLYREVLVIKPDNGEARQGLQRLSEILIARVQSALDERKFDVALQFLETARSIDANDKRLVALDEKIASLRAELGPAQILAALNAQNFDRATQLIDEAARTKLLPPAKLTQLRDEVRRRREEFEVSRLLKLVDTRLQQDHVLEPHNDSAIYYLDQAKQAGAAGPALQGQTQELLKRLTQMAHTAIQQRNFSDADRVLTEMHGIGAPQAAVTSLQRELSLARNSQTVQKPEQPQYLELAQSRLAQGKLIDPDNDNALYYVNQLRAADPKNSGLAQISGAVQSQILDRARAALEAGDIEKSEALAQKAGSLGASSDLDAINDKIRQKRAAGGDLLQMPEQSLTRVGKLDVQYPTRALQSGIEGWVEIAYTVGPDGTVSNVKILNATPPRTFESSATKAVSHLRYQPVIQGGKAIAVGTQVRIVYRVPK